MPDLSHAAAPAGGVPAGPAAKDVHAVGVGRLPEVIAFLDVVKLWHV